MKLLKLLLVAALFLSVQAPTAQAADSDSISSYGWLAKERFQIRARAIGIIPDGDGKVNGTALQTDVENSYTPEVDVTYFFSDHVAAELIAATAKHSVKAGSADLGDTWILPPTLTLQYHFTPDAAFSPYIGAGLNYSMFYGEDAGAGFNRLDVKGNFGYAVQAGFDYWLCDHWGVNFDAKYVDLSIDAQVNSGSSTLNAYDIDLNPVIIGTGISYRF